MAVLLLRPNELVPTARIVDELWGEQPPATAVKTVQVFVSQLRKALGEGVLDTQPGGYVLRLAPGALDAQRFEALLDQGRGALGGGDAKEAADVLRQALGLWRGPALADFQYDEFARNEIGRLAELRLVALEQRLEADLALGRHAEVVGELEALVRDQPLREGPRALLMLALYRSGRQADALAVYRETRTLLVDELGLDPGQTLQQLEKAILRHDPSLDVQKLIARAPAAPSAPLEERRVETIEGRRVVTLLYCELVADDALDPEALRMRTDEFVEQARAVVGRHGGRLDRFGADDVMGVFGVPAVREDDALRAVRAAIELRELGSDALRARVGVGTGEVATGDEGRLVGAAVAASRRVARDANPGDVVLAESAYVTIAHAVAVTRADDGSIRLDSVDPDAVAVPRRDDSRFVGRDAELERVRTSYDGVLAGHAQLVTVLGDPGIGKSRFVREAVAALEPKPQALIGRCPPYGEGLTFWPLRELLRQAGRELELGLPSHEVFATVRTLIAELAADGPVAVLFDDVHWAEPTFLDLVEYLASRLGEVPVLIICLARPQLAELRPTWVQPPANVIALDALSGADAEALLESLGAPAEIRAQIAEASEGNPLFAEQLAAIASEAGPGSAMPSSIRGVLHERVDRLDRDERAVLERASVAGRTFTLGAVVELSPPDETPHVHEHLLSLVRKRFVRVDPLALDEGFRFQHALIRDATYDAMPKALRADLHEQMAESLRARGVEDALVGYHLEHTFLLRRDLGKADPELAARAAGLLRQAAQATFSRSDLPAAIALLERARALLPEGDPSLPGLLTELGYATVNNGNIPLAASVLDEAVEAAVRLGNRPAELHARIERQFVRTFGAESALADENVRLATEALAELEGLGDELALARAWWLRASGDVIACRWRDRTEALEAALAHARRAQAGLDLAGTLSGLLAQALFFGPTPVEAALECVAQLLAEAGSDRTVQAAVRTSYAGLLAMGGFFDDARREFADAAATYEEFGFRFRRANQAFVGAQIELLAGDPAAAEQMLHASSLALAEFGASNSARTHSAMRADVLATLDRPDEAEAEARAVAEAVADDDVVPQVLWRTALARVHASRGEDAESARLAGEALAITRDVEFPFLRATALVAAGGEANRVEARRLLEAKGVSPRA